LDGLLLSGLSPAAMRLLEGTSGALYICCAPPHADSNTVRWVCRWLHHVSICGPHQRRPDRSSHRGARRPASLQGPPRRRVDRFVRAIPPYANKLRPLMCGHAASVCVWRCDGGRYRDLLDRWQLWHERANFDVAARRLYVSRRDGTVACSLANAIFSLPCASSIFSLPCNSSTAAIVKAAPRPR